MNRIDEFNYWRDQRVWREDRVPDSRLPTVWAICDVCRGDGKVVNPSIDAGGLSASELHEDPEFMDMYLSGGYDIECRNCKGSGKIRIVDEDRLTEAQRAIYEEWLEECRADAEYARECAYERAMGC